MSAYLVIPKENTKSIRYVLGNEQKVTIGRHPRCTLHVEDIKISARHCTIEFIDGQFFIIDQNSTNGTYVGGTKIRMRRLYHNDIIKCGQQEFHFKWPFDDSDSDVEHVDDSELPAIVPEEEPLEQETFGKINDYVIGDKIGQGGIGEVYAAHHVTSPGIVVAIKLLTPTARKDNVLVERFIREAKACIGLDHPRIVKVFELGSYKNRPYFVMEYIKGTPLGLFLRKNGAISPKNTLKIAGHIAHALTYAHKYNIIHRDLKPGNILLEESGYHVKLIDLGLAKMLDQSKLTVTHHIVGTPRYMAPEQMKDPNGIDFRVDIYSLGATMYHMITGISPFAEIISNNRGALLRYMCTKLPVAIADLVDVPEEVIHIIEKAMAKERSKRFKDANEMFKTIYKTVQILNRK